MHSTSMILGRGRSQVTWAAISGSIMNCRTGEMRQSPIRGMRPAPTDSVRAGRSIWRLRRRGSVLSSSRMTGIMCWSWQMRTAVAVYVSGCIRTVRWHSTWYGRKMASAIERSGRASWCSRRWGRSIRCWSTGWSTIRREAGGTSPCMTESWTASWQTWHLMNKWFVLFWRTEKNMVELEGIGNNIDWFGGLWWYWMTKRYWSRGGQAPLEDALPSMCWSITTPKRSLSIRGMSSSSGWWRTISHSIRTGCAFLSVMCATMSAWSARLKGWIMWFTRRR